MSDSSYCLAANLFTYSATDLSSIENFVFPAFLRELAIEFILEAIATNSAPLTIDSLKFSLILVISAFDAYPFFRFSITFPYFATLSGLAAIHA
ncbi:hypothetical protein SDC9_128709 [bioreactor metagenome]|uniref:Uncharacterized protein n=1 Tax=bioreactor metagenome TaxID=1076179 RepID=A0A645CYI5_9ZZZZ